MTFRIVLLSTVALLGACQPSAPDANTAAAAAPTNLMAAPAAVANATTPAPAPDPTPAVAGFDPAKAPVATATLGAWPYFGMIEGYQPMTAANAPGDSSKDFLKDVAFDEYEVFDGVKLIHLEGRLMTTRGTGKGASFFEARKTYEKLVHDLGGVTVFEGRGTDMAALKLKFADRRHRGYWLEKDEMGIYMVRLPDRQVWVEVYKPYNTAADNYWLTIVETKTLAARASVLPAAEMKRAIDADGRVALSVNFDTDKATIRPDSGPLVAEIVKLMQGSPELSVFVDGHTDNAGTPTRNRVLAQERARALVAALGAAGIKADRLTPRGFGADKPLASNDTEEGRAKNRRVELVKR